MADEKGAAPAVIENRNLAADIIDTIKNPALEAFVDVSETLLDMSLDESILRDLPIVGPLVGFGKVLLSIPDRLFFRKLARFMRELDHIPEKDRTAFANKLEREEVAHRVGEKVLMIVDQLDDAEKASLAGYVFKAYVTGSIDKDQFEILCSCISLTRIADLDAFLLHFERLNVLDLHVGRALSLAGLADWDINIGETSLASASVHGSIFYKPSSYGLLLAIH